MASQPFISLIVPVYHPVIDELRECIESVREQTFENWQLCMALDGPQPAEVMQTISSFGDDRIKTYERPENGGIAAASHDALGLADGEFIGLLDNDDTLAPWALQRVKDVTDEWPEVDFVYSDEDKLDEDGNRLDHFPKPGWSPERLRSHMYTGHFTCYRTSLVREVGGFRPGYDGSQDHDLALRMSEVARQVAHIPEVLYHWRMSVNSAASGPDAKPWAYDAGVRAVQSQLDRLGVDAEAKTIEGYAGFIKYEPRSPNPGRVSIIIPTGGAHRVVRGEPMRLVDNSIRSIVDRSGHENYEIVVVLDANSPDSLGAELRAIAPDRIRIVRDTRPFNYSAANNLGAIHATGDSLVFLNDDTEIVTKNWMDRILMFTDLDGVGAVGVRLNFEDGRIQHAGVMARTVPQHRARGAIHPYYGLMGGLQVCTHNCSLVTGACLGIRRDIFFEVGGFSIDLPLSYNDVDLCFKLIHEGYRNVLDMHTTLFHFESSTRDETVHHHEFERLRHRWLTALASDFYDNPVFDHSSSEEIPPKAIVTIMRERDGERFPARHIDNGMLRTVADATSQTSV